jgi:hypothetical protein
MEDKKGIERRKWQNIQHKEKGSVEGERKTDREREEGRERVNTCSEGESIGERPELLF